MRSKIIWMIVMNNYEDLFSRIIQHSDMFVNKININNELNNLIAELIKNIHFNLGIVEIETGNKNDISLKIFNHWLLSYINFAKQVGLR